MDLADHLSSSEERVHSLQDLPLSVEPARGGRPQHLVARDREEVHVHRADVDGRMRDQLGSVHEDDRAHRVCRVGQLPDGRHGSEDVRHPGDGDDLRSIRQQRPQVREVERAVLGQWDEPQDRPGGLGRELPGHQVRMMLHDGQEDLVALMEELPAVPVGHQVGRLGGPPVEHDARGVRCPDERGEFRPGFLEQRRRLLGQRVDGPVEVRVVPLVVLGHGVDDLPRLLAGVRAVEVHQWLVPDQTVQDREVLPYAIHIQRASPPRRGHRLSLSPGAPCSGLRIPWPRAHVPAPVPPTTRSGPPS